MEACERLATRVPGASRFRLSQEGCSPLAVAIETGLSFRAEKAVVEKYRRFTGRRGAPNTGKVIEIAKEKVNGKKQCAEQGKQAEIRAHADA
jgi:hypothetical protein